MKIKFLRLGKGKMSGPFWKRIYIFFILFFITITLPKGVYADHACHIPCLVCHCLHSSSLVEGSRNICVYNSLAYFRMCQNCHPSKYHNYDGIDPLKVSEGFIVANGAYDETWTNDGNVRICIKSNFFV